LRVRLGTFVLHRWMTRFLLGTIRPQLVLLGGRFREGIRFKHLITFPYPRLCTRIKRGTSELEKGTDGFDPSRLPR
jgi:hypothetical protein